MTETPTNLHTTLNGILDNRIMLLQPAKGFRFAIDTILLAAAAPEHNTPKILEMGCGVGGVMLAMAWRLQTAKITGIEIQPELAALCLQNISANKFTERLSVSIGNAQKLPPEFASKFTLITANPPYHQAKNHLASPIASKRIANMDETNLLKEWIENAAIALQPEGRFLLIHRADRTTEIQELLAPYFKAVHQKNIQSFKDSPAKRALFLASGPIKKADLTKNLIENGANPETGQTVFESRNFEIYTMPPLILHQSDGKYTDAVQDILRKGYPLKWEET